MRVHINGEFVASNWKYGGVYQTYDQNIYLLREGFEVTKKKKMLDFNSRV